MSVMPFLPSLPYGPPEYVRFEVDCSFDEMLDAMRANGADVTRGLITDDGEFIVQAND